MKTMLLTGSLGPGGAERQLTELAIQLKKRGYDVVVALLYGEGELTRSLDECGVRWLSLGKRGRWRRSLFPLAFIKALKQERPAIIYSFLPVPNIVALLLGKWLTGVPVVWGIRNSAAPADYKEPLMWLSMSLERRLARFCSLIVGNSQAPLDSFRGMGIASSRLVFIPNGIDVDRYPIDPALGQAFRRRFGISPSERLVGIVGRIDPRKDHETFLRMAAEVSSRHMDVRFLVAGSDPESRIPSLQALAATLGIAGRICWVGHVTDVVSLYNALDLVVSSSWSEGFQNVLLEALATGTPCVATDVGSARLLLPPGRIVQPRAPASLADAVVAALAAAEQGEALRQDIALRFPLSATAEESVNALRTACRMA